jgi:3-deoxy-D-manno-octulosonic-acid transferase
VPRHPERFIEVAQLCEEHNLVTVKRSDGFKPVENDQVLLGDSMGELMLFYGACDVAFVGGSLIPAGGHSLIEPAIWGAPLISGPSLFNFTEVSRLLKNANGMSVCQDSASMAEVVCEILKDTVEAKRMGDAAKLVVDSNRGALDKLMKIIELQVASR